MAFPGMYLLSLLGIVIVDLHVAQTWPSSQGLLRKSENSSKSNNKASGDSKGKNDQECSSCSPGYNRSSSGSRGSEINQNQLSGFFSSSRKSSNSSTFSNDATKKR